MNNVCTSFPWSTVEIAAWVVTTLIAIVPICLTRYTNNLNTRRDLSNELKDYLNQLDKLENDLIDYVKLTQNTLEDILFKDEQNSNNSIQNIAIYVLHKSREPSDFLKTYLQEYSEDITLDILDDIKIIDEELNEIVGKYKIKKLSKYHENLIEKIKTKRKFIILIRSKIWYSRDFLRTSTTNNIEKSDENILKDIQKNIDDIFAWYWKKLNTSQTKFKQCVEKELEEFNKQKQENKKHRLTKTGNPPKTNLKRRSPNCYNLVLMIWVFSLIIFTRYVFLN
ncbi:hypothetical protein [Lonepinella sp. BR2474]|uniref:hypothetical protein n=1 Tax=Lonepinella sp. BR2474 TaxID=3434548 RepID=UPI003F6E345E